MTAVLRTALSLERFEVTTAGDYESAMAALELVDPDVLVLDVLLPRRSGFELCRAVRRKSAVPILMISGLQGEGDVVAALEAGADDYLIKPFGVPELIARMRAALRRGPPRTSSAAVSMLRVGDVTLDVTSARVWAGEQALELSTPEFDLLRLLFENAGKTVTRADLVAGVWGLADKVSKKTVDARIRRLRAKLGPGRPIVTVRGVGFRYEVPQGD